MNPIRASDNTFQRLSVSGRSFRSSRLTAFGEENACEAKRKRQRKKKEQTLEGPTSSNFSFAPASSSRLPISRLASPIYNPAWRNLRGAEFSLAWYSHGKSHAQLHWGSNSGGGTASEDSNRWVRKGISKASRSRSPWPSPQLSIRLAPGGIGRIINSPARTNYLTVFSIVLDLDTTSCPRRMGQHVSGTTFLTCSDAHRPTSMLICIPAWDQALKKVRVRAQALT